MAADTFSKALEVGKLFLLISGSNHLVEAVTTKDAAIERSKYWATVGTNIEKVLTTEFTEIYLGRDWQRQT